MEAMEFVVGQFLGFIVGILSSLAFMYLLSFSRPNLNISDVVAHDEANDELHIRVLNKGRRYISDVSVVLFIGEEPTSGKFIRLFEPQLNADSYPALSPIGQWRQKWTLPTAITIKASNVKHILALLSESPELDRRVVLTITGVDAITSSKRIIRKTYELAKIKKGNFIPYSINEIRLSNASALTQINKALENTPISVVSGEHP